MPSASSAARSSAARAARTSPARSARTAPSRAARTSPPGTARSQPRAGSPAAAGLLGLGPNSIRVRWDRLGRVALLVVFAAVAALYLKQGLSLLETHSQAQHQRAIVQTLARQNHQLQAEQRSLRDPATITREARVLGMVRPGERPYVITGLPTH